MTTLTTDRALELAEAVFHGMRVHRWGNAGPYLPDDEILEVLRVLGELRESPHVGTKRSSQGDHS